MASGPDETSLSQERYSRVAVWLHWTIAILILANLVLGFFHDDFDRPYRSTAMMIHKSTGLLVLVLSLGRLAWRVGHRPPAFDPAMRRWERGLAHTIHRLFYVVMVALPLSGFLLSSSTARATVFYGLFSIPPLPLSKASHDFWEGSHELLAFGMIGLLFLHVAGVARHLFQGHGRMLGRMAPNFYHNS
jgi:cytochrome b561